MQQDVPRDFFFDIRCVIYPLRVSTTEPCASRMYQHVPGCCDFSNAARVFRAGHWEGSWSFVFRGGNYLQMFSYENPTKNTYVKTGVSIADGFWEYIIGGPTHRPSNNSNLGFGEIFRWCLLLQALIGWCLLQPICMNVCCWRNGLPWYLELGNFHWY